MDNIVRWSSQELGDDGELVDVILAGEQRLALQHLRKDAARAPDINLDVVFLPCEHDLRSSVVPRRHVSGHLGVLDTREAEIADLEVAVLVYEDIAGFEITMDDASRVDVFQTTLERGLALGVSPG